MLEKITKVLREYKGNDDLAVTEETTFAELELDSLDIVELVMNLEEEFGITIEMSEEIKSIGDLMKVIENA
ncbi:MAG: phosphopantetheine-binding protein [Oscillospiraceae bacterium]